MITTDKLYNTINILLKFNTLQKYVYSIILTTSKLSGYISRECTVCCVGPDTIYKHTVEPLNKGHLGTLK